MSCDFLNSQTAKDAYLLIWREKRPQVIRQCSQVSSAFTQRSRLRGAFRCQKSKSRHKKEGITSRRRTERIMPCKCVRWVPRLRKVVDYCTSMIDRAECVLIENSPRMEFPLFLATKSKVSVQDSLESWIAPDYSRHQSSQRDRKIQPPPRPMRRDALSILKAMSRRS